MNRLQGKKLGSLKQSKTFRMASLILIQKIVTLILICLHLVKSTSVLSKEWVKMGESEVFFQYVIIINNRFAMCESAGRYFLHIDNGTFPQYHECQN